MKDLAPHKGLKVNISFNLILEKLTLNGIITLLHDHYALSKPSILTSEDLNKFVEGRDIIEKIDSYKYLESNIRVIGFTEHTINVFKYRPLVVEVILNYHRNMQVKRRGC